LHVHRYAGTAHAEVGPTVLEAFVDPKSSMEVVGVAAIALGQIYISTGDGEVTDAMITLLSEKSEAELATPHAKMVALGLGLLYMGRQQEAEVASMSMVTFKSESFAKVSLPRPRRPVLACVDACNPGSHIGGSTACCVQVAKMVLDTCAYAGTGNVLKIQSLLHACSEHVDTEAEGYKVCHCIVHVDLALWFDRCVV
jgi:26S proteasome regulatory subunit N1